VKLTWKSHSSVYFSCTSFNSSGVLPCSASRSLRSFNSCKYPRRKSSTSSREYRVSPISQLSFPVARLSIICANSLHSKHKSVLFILVILSSKDFNKRNLSANLQNIKRMIRRSDQILPLARCKVVVQPFCKSFPIHFINESTHVMSSSICCDQLHPIHRKRGV